MSFCFCFWLLLLLHRLLAFHADHRPRLLLELRTCPNGYCDQPQKPSMADESHRFAAIPKNPALIVRDTPFEKSYALKSSNLNSTVASAYGQGFQKRVLRAPLAKVLVSFV